MATATVSYASEETLPLWEEPIPNNRTTEDQERGWVDGVLRIENVQVPTIEVFLPEKPSPQGRVVVICPGGGYRYLSYEKEGIRIAEWLSANGIAAFVLKYRLPDPESHVDRVMSPLLDAKRAIRLVRSRADEFGVEADRVGVMGFSAGGHLASTLGTHFDPGAPQSEDPVERLSSRPDFLVLVYPVISMRSGITHSGSRERLLGASPSEDLVARFSNELQVNADTPPTFLIHAGDDAAVPVANSLGFYQALIENGVDAEMHLYPHGGHGFGMGLETDGVESWTALCLDWIRRL